MRPNTKLQIYLKHYEIFLFLYLMCGPRQLFFQCDPETPKGWTRCVSKQLQVFSGPDFGLSSMEAFSQVLLPCLLLC